MATESWKDKYLAKLDELDKKQKSWSHLEEFLRQSIARLALASEGHSRLLDEKLLQLRKAIRKNESQTRLSLIMDEISKELVRLDSVNKNQPKGHAAFAALLFKALSLSSDMEKKSRALLKLIHAKNPPEKEVMAQEFGDFIHKCLDISYEHGYKACAQKKPKSGFLDRLFGKEEQTDDDIEHVNKEGEKDTDPVTPAQTDATQHPDAQTTDSHPHVDTDTNKRAQIEQSVIASLHNILEQFIESLDYDARQKQQLKQKLFSIKPTREIHILLNELSGMITHYNHQETPSTNSPGEEQQQIISQTHEILIQLLESIPLQDKLQQQAAQLKARFAGGLSAKQLPMALDEIAKLIIQMQQEMYSDNKMFENFLLTMADRLQEVDQFLKTNLSEHKNSWESGMALDNVVKEHVAGIGQSMRNAVDLKQLEQAIQTRLDKIMQQVETHRQMENQRVKRIQQQNQALKDKIRVLEQESSQLHNKMRHSIEKAYTDPLTKLPNRLSYDKHLEEEYHRWKRYHENLLLMIWDIDFFKKVNDTYGHQAGDAVLVKVAQLLRAHLRETDFIARFGGEEFVSLMPNTSLGGGFKVAEKIREQIQTLEFFYKGEQIQLTISCGISLFADGDTPNDVFERADKALYQAKKQGRNRCVIAQD